MTLRADQAYAFQREAQQALDHDRQWGRALSLFHNRASVSVACGAHIEKICPVAPKTPDGYMGLRVGRPMGIPLAWVLQAFAVPHERIEYTDGHSWYIVWREAEE